MSRNIRFTPITLEVGWLGTLVPLFVLLYCGNAWATYQDINIQCPGHTQTSAIYDNPAGTPITDVISLSPAPPATTKSVTWTFSASGNCTTTLPGGPVKCTDNTNTMVLTAPSTPGLDPLTFSGTVPSGYGHFSITAKDVDNSAINCTRAYDFNLLGTSGGWGDPHLTTVDGVHYNFQSAGEFTALRGKGLEIQTRQTPIATTFIPADSYSELKTCVAVYSAVAARVGKYRVTYEPNISGVPDPSGMQLRVDGVLTKLGSAGINLESDGRIIKSWTGEGSIEIDYSDGTQLVITPAYWSDQKKWYLNVNVYGTTATEGTFGQLAVVNEVGELRELGKSWLPALPDGTSLGPKPDSLHQRYLDLYGKFADAWRVTDKTSLFDYAPGTSTATFTLKEWPRENPQSCAIEGQPSAQPVDVSVAEKHCSPIVDKNMKADCVFDVSVTGHTGFAQTYLVTQQLQPGVTETTVKDDKDPTKPGENVTFTATVVQKVSRVKGAPTGTVQFILDGNNVGNPVTLDVKGSALWSTSNLSLEAGKTQTVHQISAKYIPSGWGSFTSSNSPDESHTVVAADNQYYWLIILLIIILLIIFIKYGLKLW
jgi:hypothetical protein